MTYLSIRSDSCKDGNATSLGDLAGNIAQTFDVLVSVFLRISQFAREQGSKLAACEY